jgi:LysM repeat protein
MAWGSDDQNPSLAPSQTSGVNYAAQLNSAAYYNPLSGGSSSTGMTPVAGGGGQPSYAQRLTAAAPAQPKQTTSQALVDSLMTSREKRGQSGKADQAIAPGTSRKLPISAAQGSAIQAEAARLGIAPGTLAAVIGYETIGSFDPEIVGGKKNRYKGLIQMGPNERKAYGWRDGMSFEEQLHGPVHNYLVDRGVRPGHGVAEVYSIINAGSLKRGQPRWKASDRPGWDIRRHSEEIGQTYQPRFAYLNEGSTAPYPGMEMAAGGGDDMLAGGNVPMPRMRPNTQSAAYGAGGARSMAYADEAAPEAPFDAVLAAPPQPRPRPQRDTLAPQAGPYVVRPGDNLTEIGRRFGVSVAEIASANGIRDPNLIRVGQQLAIPAAATRTGDIPQPRVRPRIASGPVGPTTARGVLDMGPRPRPGGAPDAGRVPDPRMRPEPAMAQWDDVDAMTEIDAEGNYLAQPAPQARPPRGVRESSMPLRTDEQGNVIVGPADVGREASEYRSRALAGGTTAGPGLDGLVEGFGQELRQSGRFRYPSGWTAAEIGKEVSDKREMFLQAGVPPGPQLDKIVSDYERMLKQMIAPEARGQPAVAGLQGPPAYTAGNGVRIWIG